VVIAADQVQHAVDLVQIGDIWWRNIYFWEDVCTPEVSQQAGAAIDAFWRKAEARQ
jgi:hypothetical protein